MGLIKVFKAAFLIIADVLAFDLKIDIRRHFFNQKYLRALRVDHVLIVADVAVAGFLDGAASPGVGGHIPEHLVKEIDAYVTTALAIAVTLVVKGKRTVQVMGVGFNSTLLLNVIDY